MNVFSGSLLKSPVLLEEKQFEGLSWFLNKEQNRDNLMLKYIAIPGRHISVIWPEIDILFFPFLEDIQIGVSDSRLDISTNSKPK